MEEFLLPKKKKKENRNLWEKVASNTLPSGIDRKNISEVFARKDGHFLVWYGDHDWYLFRGVKLLDRLNSNMTGAPIAWADHRSTEGLANK